MSEANVKREAQEVDKRPVWEQLDYQHDAIVEASAGTGKTYALEHIVAHLVKEHGIDIRNLLLVTFTEKAAGELKERIRRILEGTDAAKHIDETTICTIHSFCQELLNEYPFESGLQMASEVSGSDRDLIERAVRSVIVNEEFKTCQSEHYGEKMAAWNDEKDTEGLFRAAKDRLAKVVAKGLTPKSYTMGKMADAGTILSRILARMPGKLKENDGRDPGAYVLGHTEDGETLGRGAAVNGKYKTYFKGLDAAIRAVQRALESDLPLTAKGDVEFIAAGKVDFKVQGWDGVNPHVELCNLDGMVPYRELKEFAESLVTVMKEVSESTIFGETLEAAYAEYKRLKQRSRVLTFDDMILETSRVVKAAVDHPQDAARQAFLKAIRSRYRIALVDEFQDTDDRQWTIFNSLFSCKVNRIEGAKPEQGCLIVVGDPKQAIYSFRGADIDTYLRARQEIEVRRGQKISLDTMYRSTKEMVDAFNKIFSLSADESEGWFKDMQSNGLAISYDKVNFPAENIPAGVKDFKYPEGERAVELLESIPEKAEAVKAVCLPLFLQNMTAEMNRLHHESPFWMDAGKDVKDRMNWSSMCVLVKSHADGDAVLKALRAAAIPCRKHKEAGLFASAESESVLALFDYLTLPQSSGNLAALLLTPFFEFSPDEIESRLENGDPKFDALVERWRVLTAKREWVRFFESALNDTMLGLPHRNRADFVRTRTGIQQIFDQLLIRCGRAKDLTEFSDALRLWRHDDNAAGDAGSVRNRESESDAVQVMTMHAAKGLEFNAVFVPYGFTDIVAKRMAKEEKPAAIMEAKRLLYVALTRARFKLYLPWSRQMTEDTFKETTALGSFLKNGIDALFGGLQEANHCVKGDAESVKAAGVRKERPSVSDVERAPCGELPPTRGMKGWRFKWDSFSSMNHHGSTKPIEVEDVKPKNDETGTEAPAQKSLVPKGALSGTVFHEVMERLCENVGDRDSFAIGKVDDFESLIAEDAGSKSPLLEIVRRRLSANGVVTRVGPDGRESTAVSLARMAWNALRTELSVGGEKVRLCNIEPSNRKAEVNFVIDEELLLAAGGKREGALNGSIDLLVRLKDSDDYVIVDWKTNALEAYDGVSVKAAMDEAGYHLQYKIYALAAEKWLGGAKVRGAAYLFVRGGEFGDASGVFQHEMTDDERQEFAAKLADRLAMSDAAEAEKEEEL